MRYASQPTVVSMPIQPGARIGHVDADIQEVLRKPDAAEGRRGRFPLPPELAASEPQRGSEASASYAAPSSGADSFRITDTGILSSIVSNFHLSRKASKKVPSLIFSMILTAMPPAT